MINTTTTSNNNKSSISSDRSNSQDTTIISDIGTITEQITSESNDNYFRSQVQAEEERVRVEFGLDTYSNNSTDLEYSTSGVPYIGTIDEEEQQQQQQNEADERQQIQRQQQQQQGGGGSHTTSSDLLMDLSTLEDGYYSHDANETIGTDDIRSTQSEWVTKLPGGGGQQQWGGSTTSYRSNSNNSNSNNDNSNNNKRTVQSRPVVLGRWNSLGGGVLDEDDKNNKNNTNNDGVVVVEEVEEIATRTTNVAKKLGSGTIVPTVEVEEEIQEISNNNNHNNNNNNNNSKNDEENYDTNSASQSATTASSTDGVDKYMKIRHLITTPKRPHHDNNNCADSEVSSMADFSPIQGGSELSQQRQQQQQKRQTYQPLNIVGISALGGIGHIPSQSDMYISESEASSVFDEAANSNFPSSILSSAALAPAALMATKNWASSEDPYYTSRKLRKTTASAASPAGGGGGRIGIGKKSDQEEEDYDVNYQESSDDDIISNDNNNDNDDESNIDNNNDDDNNDNTQPVPQSVDKPYNKSVRPTVRSRFTRLFSGRKKKEGSSPSSSDGQGTATMGAVTSIAPATAAAAVTEQTVVDKNGNDHVTPTKIISAGSSEDDDGPGTPGVLYPVPYDRSVKARPDDVPTTGNKTPFVTSSVNDAASSENIEANIVDVNNGNISGSHPTTNDPTSRNDTDAATADFASSSAGGAETTSSIGSPATISLPGKQGTGGLYQLSNPENMMISPKKNTQNVEMGSNLTTLATASGAGAGFNVGNLTARTGQELNNIHNYAVGIEEELVGENKQQFSGASTDGEKPLVGMIVSGSYDEEDISYLKEAKSVVSEATVESHSPINKSAMAESDDPEIQKNSSLQLAEGATSTEATSFWKQRVCGIRVDRLILLLGMVVALALAIIIGSVVAKEKRGSEKEMESIANSIEIKANKTRSPAAPVPKPQSGPAPSPTSPSVKPPVEGPTESCYDSETAEFFAGTGIGAVNCTWLSTRPGDITRLCKPSEEAFFQCRQTCDNCDGTAYPTSAPNIDFPDEPDQSQPPDIPFDFTKQDIEGLLEEASPDSRAALQEPDSPQSQALDWLNQAFSDGFYDDKDFTRSRVISLWALATLALSVDTSGALSKYRWLMEPDECRWEGVRCDPEGIIHAIKLSDYDLDGTIPDEISLLNSLKELDVSSNAIRGEIPSSIGKLINLAKLRMDKNSFSGELPSSVGNLQSLELWHFERNLDIVGTFPEQLAQVTTLRDLNFYYTSLTGTVPKEMCTFLQELVLDCRQVESECWDRCFYRCGGTTDVEC